MRILLIVILFLISDIAHGQFMARRWTHHNVTRAYALAATNGYTMPSRSQQVAINDMIRELENVGIGGFNRTDDCCIVRIWIFDQNGSIGFSRVDIAGGKTTLGDFAGTPPSWTSNSGVTANGTSGFEETISDLEALTDDIDQDNLGYYAYAAFVQPNANDEPADVRSTDNSFYSAILRSGGARTYKARLNNSTGQEGTYDIAADLPFTGSMAAVRNTTTTMEIFKDNTSVATPSSSNITAAIGSTTVNPCYSAVNQPYTGTLKVMMLFGSLAQGTLTRASLVDKIETAVSNYYTNR